MAFTPLNKKLVAFLDCETTGLNPGEHEVIEVAILRSDGLTYTTKIKPEHIATAHPKALQVNGYNEEEWADAPRMKDVIETILGVLKDCVIIGQNVGFDVGFLKYYAELFNIKVGFGYHNIDTATLAWEHLVPCGLGSLSMKNVCEFLGIPPEPDMHRALAGATTCKLVYETLVRASWLDRMGWRLRHAGRSRKA